MRARQALELLLPKLVGLLATALVGGLDHLAAAYGNDLDSARRHGRRDHRVVLGAQQHRTCRLGEARYSPRAHILETRALDFDSKRAGRAAVRELALEVLGLR